MAEKVTVMVLKVDLQCPCCYKKVKKILCKFPQIRDQVFDEKENKITITVVCCSPEKIRDKLCYKGSRVIKSIEIKEPPKPKEPEKPKQAEKPKEPEKPKQLEEPNVIVIEKPKEPKVVVIEKPKELEKSKVIMVEKPKEPEKPKEAPKPKKVTFELPKDAPNPKEAPKSDPPENPGPSPGPPKMPNLIPYPVPTQGYPSAFPMQPCCAPCYEGYGGGPCYQGYGVPPPSQPCYDGYYGYDNGYHGRPTHVTRCDYYFNDENPQSCSIM